LLSAIGRASNKNLEINFNCPSFCYLHSQTQKGCRTGYLSSTIALLHHDVTIKTFIKFLLFNTRDHGRLAGTKECKFTEDCFKNHINSQREVE